MRSRKRSRRTSVPDQVETGPGTLRDRAQEAVEALAPRLESARDNLAPRLESARGAAGEALTDAGEWAAPRIDAAREQALTTVRERVAPLVAQALSNAAVASAPAREEAKHRTEAALAALRGEALPPRRRRRTGRAGFLLTAGAVTGVLVALVVRRREPAYSGFEMTGTTPSDVDPYAQPVPSPALAEPPITPMNDDVTADIAGAEATEPPGPPADGEGPTTIDVTDEPVSLGAENATGRNRRRGRHASE